MPERIQRKRTKGWRMPKGAVYVGRPTQWGNRYVVGQAVEHVNGARVNPADAADAVRLYREWVAWQLRHGYFSARELAGKDLACWCPLDQPCHADVLLELANPPQPKE